MIPTESTQAAVRLLDSPAPCDETAARATISSCEAEEKCQSFPSMGRRELAVPAWENLWIDFGGEG